MTDRDRLIKKLKDNAYGLVTLITMNGITIAEIQYVDVMQEEDNKDNIYLVVDSTSLECVSINYKAIKYVREFKEIVELTVG